MKLHHWSADRVLKFPHWPLLFHCESVWIYLLRHQCGVYRWCCRLCTSFARFTDFYRPLPVSMFHKVRDLATFWTNLSYFPRMWVASVSQQVRDRVCLRRETSLSLPFYWQHRSWHRCERASDFLSDILQVNIAETKAKPLSLTYASSDLFQTMSWL